MSRTVHARRKSLFPAFRPLAVAAIAVFAAFSHALAPASAATEVDRVVSPAGIEAWLVQDHQNPIISMRFAFRGGAALDPAGKEGLATLVSSLVDEGAGELDSKSFQQTLEDLAITLRFDASMDTFGGRVRTLTENKDKAFELLRLAITNPRFDEEPVERIRAQILAGLRQDEENPQSIAGRELSKALFPNHPYGRSSEGTLDSVKSITADDLRAFVGRRLGLDNLVIGVVGDITPEQLGPLLDEVFGSLPKNAASWAVPEVKPTPGGRTLVVNKPVPQSAILFADEGLKREDPDFYAAFVLNHMLGGGGFTSRLYNEVREKRGLAYSVFATLHPLDHSSLYLGGAGTANERVAETLQVIRDEWKRMGTQGVGTEELNAAKKFLVGSFPLRFTSSERIASMLVNLQLDDLGIDYLEKRNGYINSVTQADIYRVAKKLLDPEGLTFVVVGQPKGVQPTN